MTRYRPFVDAVQWTGSNVTEIRQFVRAHPNCDAVIRDGLLYITYPGIGGVSPGEIVISEYVIAQTEWAVFSGDTFVGVFADVRFQTLYRLDP
jgi:hypothetical protein